MTTYSIITLLAAQNPDWNEARLLDVLNSFVEMALKIDTAENLVYDPTTGRLPYLATTQGTFLYSLPSQYYKCKYILTHKDYGFGPYGYPNNPAFGKHHDHYTFNTQDILLGGHRYRQVPVVFTPSFGTNPATVLFSFDPLNTTDVFHIYAHQAGNSITSMNSVLQIESKFHLSVVIPACQMIIDGLDNGNFQDIMPIIETQFCSKIWTQKYYNSQPDSTVEALGL
jgi:hypothetical protein